MDEVEEWVRGEVAMYGCKGQVVFVLAVGCTENGRLEEEEFV
ncbi:hypothetical protein P5775_28410 [Bacillus cereus]|nr:hypothetical protein [Bacillus cereus]MDF9626618.1 hypothetical protein [Bacillus cereus]